MNTMIRTASISPTASRAATRVHSNAERRSELSPRRGAPASPYRRVDRPRATRQPNYVMRRCVAAAVSVGVVLSMVVLVNGLLASFGGRPASAAETRRADEVSQFVAPTATYVAQPGDSLWSIAEEHRGDIDLDRYVDELVRLNGDTAIVVGQAILLPF